MEFVSVGKIMGPFALKGEVKIASDFKFADSVFALNKKLYVGANKKEVTIVKTRFYKNRYYVLFDGYNHINEINDLIKQIVYVNKEDLNLDEETYLDQDIIGFSVKENDQIIGTIEEVRPMPNNRIFGVLLCLRTLLKLVIVGFMWNI